MVSLDSSSHKCLFLARSIASSRSQSFTDSLVRIFGGVNVLHNVHEEGRIDLIIDVEDRIASSGGTNRRDRGL